MANQPKKYKKFVATAATATLVASAIVPVASAASLSDIKGNTHEEAITALVDAGVINGYPDGTFQPNKTLTRSDVVKLLGKFLVSKGHEVPSDYKTNVRFNDLSSSSNDELLKYAAVVYDAGVFNGSNGNLLAADNITRENMAVVLVRAFDTLNNIDLVSYVQDQEYKKDVKDLYTAKAEARAAIEVLDFFDITNPSVANFNPKGSTTRGHFATFLYNTMNADFSAVTGVANSAVSEIKAINNTTVEVTFKDAVDNIEALDFAIEGLEVKDAVVKQTDAKTVVLTTAPQTGDKVYTLNVNAAKAGTFKGISAVIPTAINVTTPSVQGTIGQQVTVKASVTVPEGQSKAGIPVTFNIVNDNSNLNEKIEVVAYTNAEGVATYNYTRYYEHNDNVVAYATQKSAVSAQGKVYWNAKLSVTEITTGNELANNTKKSYKVNGKANTVYQIALKENIDVNPDQVTNGVKVISLNGVEVIPAQVKGATPVYAEVRTNANGEGSFTVYGSNASATPVVYLSTATNKAYTKYDLQDQAPTVKFAQVDRLALTVAAVGNANSAQYAADPQGAAYNANSVGGRTYNVTVTDKDGKLAPAGTVAYVTFEDGNIEGNVYFSTGTQAFDKVTTGTVKQIVIGQEGKAQFRVAGSGSLTFVKPTVFLNTAGKTAANEIALDKADVQQVAEVTYFKAPVVTNAVLSVTDQYGRTVSSLNAGQDAYFTYQSVDQNGFAYRPAGISAPSGTSTTTTVWVPVTLADGTIGYKQETITLPGTTTVYEYNLSFDVTSTFGNAIVKDALGATLPVTQNLGNTKTYTVKSDANGKAIVRVTSTSSDQVSVNVTGTNNILPTAGASVSFTSASIVPTLYTGVVESIDSSKQTLKFAGKDSISYVGNNVSYRNVNNTPIANADDFAKALFNATGPVEVTYEVKNGVTTFYISKIGTGAGAPVDTANAPAVTATLVDTDLDANEIGGVLAISATNSTVSSVTVNGTALVPENGLYTVAQNTPANATIVVTVANAVGKTTSTTVNVTDVVGALQKATAAVVTAETSKTQATVDTAQALVTALPAGADKTALQGRLDVVQAGIDAAAAVTAATNAVAAAEASKAQADVDAAQALVTALPAGADKTALQTRLDAITVTP